MAGLLEVFIGLTVAVYALYSYLTRHFDHWTKQGVAGPRPIPFFGTFKDVILRKTHSADFWKLIYDAYPNERAIGLFVRTTPMLMIKDPNIMKDVFIKHFTTFPNRGAKIHPDVDPLSQHLIHLEYERWKPMRQKLSPTFTSGKLKGMFSLTNECAVHFVKYMEKIVEQDVAVECHQLVAKYTMDVIGVCAFGLSMNAVDDPDSEFFKYGRMWFEGSWFNLFRRGVRSLPSWAAKLFKSIARNDQVVDFFVNTITSSIEYRKKNNIRRNDFVDLLRDLKDNPDETDGEEMTDILLTAQAFIFFLAGFETSSMTISHAMYELALNPDIQDRLRRDIQTVLDKHNGKLDHEIITEIKYLDKVVKETLRKYPPAFHLTRVAVDDHTFENDKISVRKGTPIKIPVYAIHHDANIYPDPEKFDPERFDEDIVNSRPPMSYLPFGDGPRYCIGKRFGLNQSKLGLIAIVKNFQLEVCDKTFREYKKDHNKLLLAPVGGIYLRTKKI